MKTVLIHVGFSRFTEHKKQQKVVNFTKNVPLFCSYSQNSSPYQQRGIVFFKYSSQDARQKLTKALRSVENTY